MLSYIDNFCLYWNLPWILKWTLFKEKKTPLQTSPNIAKNINEIKIIQQFLSVIYFIINYQKIPQYHNNKTQSSTPTRTTKTYDITVLVNWLYLISVDGLLLHVKCGIFVTTL
jgi:hypothetical protein